MGMCKHCNGTGRQYVESGSSLCYGCPDCGGSGFIPECDVCGEEYEGDYCEDCYAQCAECGTICMIDDMIDGLCDDCTYEAEEMELQERALQAFQPKKEEKGELL